ncbi:MAG: tyrosine-protein phosphatase [Ilumatobacteraceae bacterium]
MSTASPTRNLTLDGVFNFRDLGGYAAADGRHVRWRTVFRADGLGRLTAADVEALRPLGLKAVIDLRTERELDRRGRFPVETYPVTFHHLSVLDQTWDRDAAIRENLPATEFLHRAYTEILANGGPRFGAALEVLAQAEHLPAVFHCAAGKDRTGLLAALLLGLLGVDRDVIVADYELTQDTMERFLARTAAEDPELAASMAQTPPSFHVADPDAMALVIGDLEREHGSVAGYVETIGVGADGVARLRDLLLTAD